MLLEGSQAKRAGAIVRGSGNDLDIFDSNISDQLVWLVSTTIYSNSIFFAMKMSHDRIRRIS
ncbi:MAG: hypothetical protein PHE66_09495, partial [Syntrophaceticus schinkii]|nr:hypothetical protein [Syntrophaceticus schinkii]